MPTSGFEHQEQHSHQRCPGCIALEQRLKAMEDKLNQWEDRAGFLRSIIIVAIMTIGSIVSALEWIRTHISLK